MMLHIEDPTECCPWCGSRGFFHQLWLRAFCTVYRQMAQQWVGGAVPTEGFKQWEREAFERAGHRRPHNACRTYKEAEEREQHENKLRLGL